MGAIYFKLFLNLFLTIVAYSLPILIYRFAILQRPSTEPLAITLGYGLIAFIIVAVIISENDIGNAPSYAIVIWSYVNYRILKGGKDTRKPPLSRKELKEKYASVLAEIDALPYNQEPDSKNISSKGK